MNKTFCIGDIHGGYKALLQCLERSKFNNNEDILIQLGDVVDGWSESFEVVEELLKIKCLIPIIGNHDDWWNTYLTTSQHPQQFKQGAQATLDSYINNLGENLIIPESHRKFFRNQHLYYHDTKNRFFVHGGFNRNYSVREIKQTQPYEFYWDRTLWNKALSCKKNDKIKTIDNFNEIFIGHTTTIDWYQKINGKISKIITPMNSGGVWNLDTGGGYDGKLTIMNVDTKEYWQSDLLIDLYPLEKGRN
jgi:serine/threonine protein phosphatase 1